MRTLFSVSTRLGLLLLILAGCRTYGGHSSEALTFDQIEEAVQNYAQAYDRARANAALLERRTADGDSAMKTLTRKYKRLTAKHKATLARQREQMDDLRGSDNYRSLSRMLGGVVKEQQVTAKAYRTLLASYQSKRDTTASASDVPYRSRYHLVPPFYEAARDRKQPHLPGLERAHADSIRRNQAASDTTRAL